MRVSLYLFVILTISCTKVEEVFVDGNTHPIDPTIENMIIENYVNKLYISTIGRELQIKHFTRMDLAKKVVAKMMNGDQTSQKYPLT